MPAIQNASLCEKAFLPSLGLFFLKCEVHSQYLKNVARGQQKAIQIVKADFALHFKQLAIPE